MASRPQPAGPLRSTVDRDTLRHCGWLRALGAGSGSFGFVGGAIPLSDSSASWPITSAEYRTSTCCLCRRVEEAAIGRQRTTPPTSMQKPCHHSIPGTTDVFKRCPCRGTIHARSDAQYPMSGTEPGMPRYSRKEQGCPRTRSGRRNRLTRIDIGPTRGP